MRGIRQVNVSAAPSVRGRDLRKACPVRVGINDASKNDTSAFVPRRRAQSKEDNVVGTPVKPGWARKYS